MGAKGGGSWRRVVNRYVGLIAALVGMAVVLSSLLFLDNLVVWYATIMTGLAVVLGGFLYGAHPFLTNERRHRALREEVDRFMELVRQLNEIAVSSGSEDELEHLKSRMIASVEQMAAVAEVRSDVAMADRGAADRGWGRGEETN